MWKKSSLALVLIALGSASSAAAEREPEVRSSSPAVAVRSTARILPGVQLNWSSTTPGTFEVSNEKSRADVTRSALKRPDSDGVVIYVDFS